MSVHVLFLAAALATGVVNGQQPTTAPPKPSSNTPDDRLTTPAIPPTVAVEGCVAREEEIPGRKSNMAERARLAEDFILVGARVLKGKGPAVGKDPPGGVASTALQPMYEIGGLTDEQLKLHVGRRVRIEGSFGNLDREAPCQSQERRSLRVERDDDPPGAGRLPGPEKLTIAERAETGRPPTLGPLPGPGRPPRRSRPRRS